MSRENFHRRAGAVLPILVLAAWMVFRAIHAETPELTRHRSVSSSIKLAESFSTKLFAEDSPQYPMAVTRTLNSLLQSDTETGGLKQALHDIQTGEPNPIELDPRYALNLQSLLTTNFSFTQVRPFVLHADPGLDKDFPDAVMVKGAGDFCSGVAITNTTVVTSLHCVCGGVSELVGVGAEKLEFKKVVAAPVMLSTCESLKAGHPVADVAILKTEPLGISVPKAVPATTSIINAAQVGRLVGYGWTMLGFGQTRSGERRRGAWIPIVSNACNQAGADNQSDSDRYNCFPGIELVAAAQTGADQCHGDSGAPLFSTDAQGRKYLLAIAARPVKGSAQHGGCGIGGIYERVDGEVGERIAKIAELSDH